ncbi:armadillo/beta-catenin/plakoglobin [Moesziomyces antarcticus]|uniref:Uridine kinase n=1 Tax=Pseudozyma antarctica TaxID=84753 RepID=A0A5C3FJH7_PSEA2|nr:armadillo/beta-catenin/plakoglobin [Moesziomyces antarcticus]GAK63885.1 armadillo/beta-catenin/plakoglobin [Moesziomyces antarcticus]SPO44494.1 related to uridine kinase [Moesziomyces antarcticus]
MQAAKIVQRPSGNGTPILQPVTPGDKPGSGSSHSVLAAAAAAAAAAADPSPSMMSSTASLSAATPSAKPSGSGTSAATRSKTIVLTDAGRAPWYNSVGEPVPAYVVGIAGGSASGKTSVAREILKRLPNVPWVAIVSQDAYYKSLTPEQSKLAFQEQYDFDHPDAFDYDILKQCIKDLRQSKAVEIPVYSFVKHQRTSETNYLYGPAVLIVEGIFVLHDPEIRDLFDLKVYVQADSDLMLARRIKRDIVERGRSVNSVLDQYLRFVKPAFDTFVSATARHADMIVPGSHNEVAIEVISQHMEKQLRNRSRKLRAEFYKTTATQVSAQAVAMSPYDGLGSPHERRASATPMKPLLNRNESFGLSAPQLVRGLSSMSVADDTSLPPNVIMLAQKPQLQGLLSILHDRSTPTSEFTFACKRVGTLVVELATTLLPYKLKEITIHGGRKHIGHELNVSSLCSVSILRSGAVLEPSLRRAFPAMSLGSLLIQSNEDDGEPHLYDVSLPSFIRRRETAEQSWVFLLDAQIGTGAAAFMAIRVLLDHSVPEHQIIFLTLLASSQGGIHALNRAFPRVRIVVAGVDPGLQKLRIPWQTSASSSAAAKHQRTESGEAMRSFADNAPVDEDDLSPGLNRRSDLHLLASPPLLSIDGRFGSRDERGAARGSSASVQRQPSTTQSPAKGSRVVFAITPGCGSIGDRFWGTGSR